MEVGETDNKSQGPNMNDRNEDNRNLRKTPNPMGLYKPQWKSARITEDQEPCLTLDAT